jgi:hypothetical protein
MGLLDSVRLSVGDNGGLQVMESGLAFFPVRNFLVGGSVEPVRNVPSPSFSIRSSRSSVDFLEDKLNESCENSRWSEGESRALLPLGHFIKSKDEVDSAGLVFSLSVSMGS